MGFLRRKRKASPNQDIALNITSMADIFTILLVFLLKSYATASIEISPSNGTSLPIAEGLDTTVEALKIEITQNAVLIEGKPTVTLSNYQFQASDRESNGASKNLIKNFAQSRKLQRTIASQNKDVQEDSKIIVLADRKVPYSTLKVVLTSAALNGYTDFKLAVVRKGD